jgi:Phage integrase family
MRPVDCRLSDRVFSKMPRMDQHKEILATAKIDYLECLGRQADFHALRHTFDTNLARAGIPERLRQALMRHKTLRLTNETYTDVRLLPTVEAIGMLPGLEGGDSQIDSQNLVTSSQGASEAVSVPAWLHPTQPTENEDESHGEALPVTTGQSEEVGCRARTRT